MGFFI